MIREEVYGIDNPARRARDYRFAKLLTDQIEYDKAGLVRAVAARDASRLRQDAGGVQEEVWARIITGLEDAIANLTEAVTGLNSHLAGLAERDLLSE